MGPLGKQCPIRQPPFATAGSAWAGRASSASAAEVIHTRWLTKQAPGVGATGRLSTLTVREQMATMRTIETIEELKELVGQELGVGGWFQITQERVDAFADVTGDHQWIHVDPARAANTPFGGTIKSSIGLGILLSEGIGDTIRVSLAAEPHEEVRVGWEILKSLELRKRGVTVVACPTCGRLDVDNFVEIVTEIERRLAHVEEPLHLSIMGCAVNGPGEAGDADFGIAGGRETGFIYAHGRVLKKVPSEVLVDELFSEIDTWIADGMERPKRLKLAKPAALMMAEAAQRA